MPAGFRARARAHAKINLGLKIAGLRPDGFHELRTIYQTLALADRLEMEIRPGPRGGAAVVLETSGLDAPSGEANLAFRAAALAAPAFGVRGRIALRLHKRIPAGAGLGGGSSDAAAVLRLLALAAPRPPAATVMLDLAAQLGSDVPAFLLGGTVLGLGRGEEVYTLPDLPAWSCVLVMPGSGPGAAVSTPAAFARWDATAGLTPPPASATIMEFCSLVQQVLPAFRTLRNRGAHPPVDKPGGGAPKVQAGIENDLLAGVFSLSPDFPRIHRQLLRSQAVWAGLSGSGSVQFGLFASAAGAEAAQARLALRYRCWRTRFITRREYVRGAWVTRR